MKKGMEAYDAFYSNIYKDRWTQLKKALQAPTKHVARKNAFYADNYPTEGVGETYPHLSNCYYIKDNFDLKNFSSQILPYYKMDPASIFAALALEVQTDDQVLDMCAAPGGKALVLCEALGDEGHLLANEYAAKRRFRMMSVFKRYVSEQRRKQVHIKGVDGGTIGLKRKEAFDRILLDAPCSGDRGLLQKPTDIATWSPKRSKNFGIRQYALLASAFMALKPGGRIVYSTCSISPYENDGVIDKLFKKQKDKFKVIKKEQSIGEPTEHGWIILPDTADAGPIYFAIIEKL